MSKIINKLKKNKLIYGIYQKILCFIINNKKNKEYNKFKKNGEKVLFYMQAILTEINVDFYFGFGTCLGIYRDNKLIKKDADIDIGIYLNNIEFDVIKNKLLNCGLVLKYEYSIDNIGTIQYAFECKKIRVDVTRCFRNSTNDFYYVFYEDKVIKFETSKIDSQKYVFKNKEINMPKKITKYLEETYGENWNIPNSDYKYWENPRGSFVNLRGKTIKY